MLSHAILSIFANAACQLSKMTLFLCLCPLASSLYCSGAPGHEAHHSADGFLHAQTLLSREANSDSGKSNTRKATLQQLWPSSFKACTAIDVLD